jgi:hypothetical protein
VDHHTAAGEASQERRERNRMKFDFTIVPVIMAANPQMRAHARFHIELEAI